MSERTRRSPIQARAIRRREAILDATAQLLDHLGVDGTSTNAIARAAGMSIGALYDYFPNKEVLLQALLERYRSRLGEAIASAMAPRVDGDWGALLDSAVDAFARVYRTEPGYRSLWLGAQTTLELRRAGTEWGDDFVSQTQGWLSAIAPTLPPQRCTVVARTLVFLISGLVNAALLGPETTENALIDEAKVAARAYLATQIVSSLGT